MKRTTRYVLDLGHGRRRIYYDGPLGVLAVTQRRVRVNGRVLWSYVDSAQVAEVPYE